MNSKTGSVSGLLKGAPIQILSLCPLTVSSLTYRDTRGAHLLTVIAKATFDLLPANSGDAAHASPVEARLSAEQEQVAEDDNYWEHDATRSVYCPSDVVPFKARADVMLVGYAFSPGGERVRSVNARLQVGSVDKAIRVVAERYVATDGSVHEGLPFTKMPLRFERAPGGPETSNPVGIVPESDASLGRALLPNLLPVEGASAAEYVGFGPLAPTWPERRKRLGRREGSWPVPGWREMPLPIDVEAAYFNSAPPEQRLDTLRGDETITLENLHALEARLVTRLPSVRPRAFFETSDRAAEEVTLVCDTLWIDTNRAICTLTWRGQIGVGDGRRAGRVLVALEGPARSLRWEDVKQRCLDLDIGPLSPLGSEAIPPAPMTQARSPAVAAHAGYAFSNGDRAFEETSTSSPLATLSAEERLALVRSFNPLEPHDPTDDTLVARMRRPGPNEEPAKPARQVDVAVVSARRTDDLAPGLLGSSLPPPTTQNVVKTERVSEAGARAVTEAPKPPLRGDANAGKLPISPPVARRPSPLTSTAVSPSRTSKPPPFRPPQKTPSPVPRPGKPTGRELFDLIWADESASLRLRQHRPFAELLRTAEQTTEAALDELVGNKPKPTTARDRRIIVAALARAPRTDADGLLAQLASAMNEDGDFEPPLVAVLGGINFPFHEVEALRATVIALSPFVDESDRIREKIVLANRVLEAPWSASASPIAEVLTHELEDAFSEHQHERPIGYLERSTERILLEGRHYQRRVVFGARYLRSLIVPFGATTPVPTYVPEVVGELLPMFRGFKASLIAEVVTQQDQREEHPVALRAVALARVLPVP